MTDARRQRPDELIRQRFREHLDPMAPTKARALAEEAIRLTVAVGKRKRAAARREPTAKERADLAADARELAEIVCKLGIEPRTRRQDAAARGMIQSDDNAPEHARLRRRRPPAA